jgi:hypothetical protein
LYPFKTPDKINNTDFNKLSICVARSTPSYFSLAAIRRFPGVLFEIGRLLRTPGTNRGVGSHESAENQESGDTRLPVPEARALYPRTEV